MPNKSRPLPDAPPDAKARAAFYKSAKWKAFRSLQLTRRVVFCESLDCSLCVHCEAPGDNYNPMLIVDLDHIVSIEEAPERAFDPDNVQFLCKKHHGQKTQQAKNEF